ncbi:MAG: type II toxin-antitoxin system RelE/ParE family toxin [Phascolarctobacterium sp.]|nr:type II toxin-antitoxin system RelE/ParE family toxin [Phascolarctobacterium sp.]MBR6511210.1 type II toxin-antitoxin system RelE/ParE family toxin [Phascolarctobacterium sp.]
MEKFNIIMYETEAGRLPVVDFLSSIKDDKLLAKIYRDIKLLEVSGNLLREPYSKALNNGLFELRTKQGTNISRIIYFFIVGNNIVLTNGFIKKTQKTPISEIEKALEYRKDFLKRYNGGNYEKL